MRIVTVAAITLVMRATLVAQVVEVPATGVIFGTAVYSNGRPASGVGLTALGSGQALSGRLPRVKTDNEGNYRFEHLLLGTYVVQADDEQAGLLHLRNNTAQRTKGPTNGRATCRRTED
jgi:hypothetical protein